MQEFIEDMQVTIPNDIVLRMNKFVSHVVQELMLWAVDIANKCQPKQSGFLSMQGIVIGAAITDTVKRNLDTGSVTKEKAYDLLFDMTNVTKQVFELEKVLLYDEIIDDEYYDETLTEHMYLCISILSDLVVKQ